MPHPTAPTGPAAPGDHAAHDPLLVAAYVAGEATGAQLDKAAGQVATCADCAALHRDLRSIVAALPATAATAPSPRPRDFRLTGGQAASLHPSGWRRLLAPLAGPSFAFARPLGTGLATIGLAGILVAGASGIPLGGGAAAGAAGGEDAMQAPMTAAAPAAEASPADQQLYEGNAAASEAPAAGGGPGAVPEPTVLEDGELRTGSGGPDREASPTVPDEPLTAVGAPIEEPVATAVATEGAPFDPAPSPVAWIAGGASAALALGLLLLALRWTARRLA